MWVLEIEQKQKIYKLEGYKIRNTYGYVTI